MTNESTRLRDFAAIWKAKALAAHAEYSAARRPDGPYQSSRLSPYHSASALFSACAEAEARLTEAATVARDFERERGGETDWTLTELKDLTIRVKAYHRALQNAECAVKRATEVEEAIAAAKLAAEKSEAAIAEEIEAVWNIRKRFWSKNVQVHLGMPR